MNRLGQQATDAELWAAIRGGDESAFRMLYDRYWTVIYSTAFSYLHDRAACAEIVQTIFLGIWLKRQELNIGDFNPYLKAASRYQVYKRLKLKGTLRILYKDPLAESATRATRNQGEDNIRYQELQSSLEAGLQGLPERCREIFLLSRREQLSIAEIAERLDISRRTVENQLTRALQHLRHSLGDLFVILLLVTHAFPILPCGLV
ncbi:MAG TPA: sigma-70 family RNA polymerase sigma factor [Puia sp.]|nr:sigma-70 family RNA polymerase sigma factor [Puia sp.]